MFRTKIIPTCISERVQVAPEPEWFIELLFIFGWDREKNVSDIGPMRFSHLHLHAVQENRAAADPVQPPTLIKL